MNIGCAKAMKRPSFDRAVSVPMPPAEKSPHASAAPIAAPGSGFQPRLTGLPASAFVDHKRHHFLFELAFGGELRLARDFGLLVGLGFLGSFILCRGLRLYVRAQRLFERHGRDFEIRYLVLPLHRLHHLFYRRHHAEVAVGEGPPVAYRADKLSVYVDGRAAHARRYAAVGAHIFVLDLYDDEVFRARLARQHAYDADFKWRYLRAGEYRPRVSRHSGLYLRERHDGLGRDEFLRLFGGAGARAEREGEDERRRYGCKSFHLMESHLRYCFLSLFRKRR